MMMMMMKSDKIRLIIAVLTLTCDAQHYLKLHTSNSEDKL